MITQKKPGCIGELSTLYHTESILDGDYIASLGLCATNDFPTFYGAENGLADVYIYSQNLSGIDEFYKLSHIENGLADDYADSQYLSGSNGFATTYAASDGWDNYNIASQPIYLYSIQSGSQNSHYLNTNQESQPVFNMRSRRPNKIVHYDDSYKDQNQPEFVHASLLLQVQAHLYSSSYHNCSRFFASARMYYLTWVTPNLFHTTSCESPLPILDQDPLMEGHL